MIILNATFINNNMDIIIWGDNLNGKYSFSSIYFSLWDSLEKPIWAQAWIFSLTPKINIFFSLLLQEKIIALDNLAKRGKIIPNRCSLYKHDVEMINHLFILYPYSSKVWNLLTMDFGFSWCPLANIQDFFFQWRSYNSSLKSKLINS